MQTSRIRFSVPIALFLAILVPAAATAADGERVRYHFDEALTLVPDPTRVVLHMQDPPASRSTALQSLDLRANEAEALPIDGWWSVPVVAGRDDRASLDARIAGLAADPAVDFAAPVFLDDDGGVLIPTGHLIVRFDTSVFDAAARDLIAKLDPDAEPGARGFAGLPDTYRIDLSTRDGFTALAVANELARRDDTVFAEVDMIGTGRRALIPNDQYFGLSWGLDNQGQEGGTVDADMDAPEAWDVTLGDPNVLVAILDTGVDPAHPDINQIAGYDATDQNGGGAPVNACDNHGTAVAGCVSSPADNSIGTAGIAPNTKIISIRPFVSNVPAEGCDGSWYFFYSWFADALNHATAAGCQITNNSNYFNSPSSTVATAYQVSRDAGVVHFASAGNSGDGFIGYPALLTTVNAVGALDRTGVRASFSQFGNQLAFSAPGQQIVSTDVTGAGGYVDGDYVYVNGTSFASPFAAGVAALVLTMNPGLDPDGIEAVMQETSVDLGAPGWDTEYGWGFVNAFNAVTWTEEREIVVDVRPLNPLPGPISIYSRLDGLGDPISQARYWDGVTGNPSVVVDATIRVQLTDTVGNPVVGFPAENIGVTVFGAVWFECVDARVHADAPTDANGITTISGPLFARGHTELDFLMEITVDDPNVVAINYPDGAAGLDYRVNSADISRDFEVNLIDIGQFSIANAGSYDYHADFVWDGVIDLADVGRMALAVGTSCPSVPARTATPETHLDVTDEIALVFDSGASARLAPGETIEAALVVRGAAAARGVTAFDARVRASDNVRIENVDADGLHFGDGDDLVVGLGAVRRATTDAGLVLARVRLSVTDERPAHVWIEPSGSSTHTLPTLATDGEVVAARPTSGNVTLPVASLNDANFDLGAAAVHRLEVGVAPNPFNPRTEILCRLPQTADVDVRVIDARGKVVARLHHGALDAGAHVFVWNGTDDAGTPVASGVYYTSVRADEETQNRKMLLLK